MNRDGAMAVELSRLLAATLQRFYMKRTGSAGAPAQIAVIQRFGSRMNLHVHLHAVVSDGVFQMDTGGRLRFIPAAPPSPEELSELIETIRRRGLISGEAAETLLGQAHSGFSLNAEVRIESEDRAGLERLLRYCLRPVLPLCLGPAIRTAGKVRRRRLRTGSASRGTSTLVF
ncbi:MAG: transposase [Elusimicrobia bacterium]|nr:transposase [Elusimicrobiota bacterium]